MGTIRDNVEVQAPAIAGAAFRQAGVGCQPSSPTTFAGTAGRIEPSMRMGRGRSQSGGRHRNYRTAGDVPKILCCTLDYAIIMKPLRDIPMSPEPVRVDAVIEKQMDHLSAAISQILEADVIGIIAPIFPGLETIVRRALEENKIDKRSEKLAIVIDTNGGVIEIVDRMVQTIRHFYKEVVMIIPDKAMSAGTVFAMAGDSIMMDYSSCLGPIDPQIMRNNKFVPALSYLVQYDRLMAKSSKGKLTTAEVILLQQLDLAELHSFEEAKALSISLLKTWLATYKFKDWKLTDSRKLPVTAKMRKDRAEQIAKKLINHEHWHSHSRPISMEVLRKDLNLKIDDFGSQPTLSQAIRDYHQFLKDYMGKFNLAFAVHAKGIFLI